MSLVSLFAFWHYCSLEDFFPEKVKLKIRRITNEILYNSGVCKKQDGRRESH